MNKALLLSSLIILFSVFQGCADENASQPLSETRLLLNTVCTITIYDPGANPAPLSRVFDLCAEYEAMFSRTVEGSDIWRINNAGGEAVSVDPRTAELILSGIYYGKLLGGKFDITIGRVSELWNFGAGANVPDSAALAEARDTVDFRGITVTGNTVRLADPRAALDLGGIAKGWIADRAAEFLIAHGVESAIINLGGDIRFIGLRSGGEPWRVGVQRPFAENGELAGVISTGAPAVASSGVYERFFECGGVIYHHILDPSTGFPVQTDIAGVTLIAESAMIADAVSTLIILAGSERAGEIFAQAAGLIGAVLILKSGEIIELGDIDFEKF